MSHINPQLPADGQQNWAATADSYLTTLTNQINLHDDQIANLAANGGTGGGNTIVDNGDGTITILPSGSTSTAPTAQVGAGAIALDADGTPYLVL